MLSERQTSPRTHQRPSVLAITTRSLCKVHGIVLTLFNRGIFQAWHLQNYGLRCNQTGQGLAALRNSTAVAEETHRGVYPIITQHITRFPMQYLKFTYRLLICENTISCCSCCIRDQYNTVVLLTALCCHSCFLLRAGALTRVSCWERPFLTMSSGAALSRSSCC